MNDVEINCNASLTLKDSKIFLHNIFACFYIRVLIFSLNCKR